MLMLLISIQTQNGGNGEGNYVPFAMFSPPAGVISVEMTDPQIYSFQFPPGTEHYRWGWYGNGFGVGHTYGGTFYGYVADEGFFVSLNLLGSGTYVWGPSVYRWWTQSQTSDGYIQVDQVYAYCPSIGALRGRTIISNISSVTLTGVKFKRFIDWDVNGSFFNDFYYDATYEVCYATLPNYYVALGNLVPTLKPVTYYTVYGWDDYYQYPTATDPGPYTSYDGLCLLDWLVGDMAPGQADTFQYCWAAGSTYSDMISALSSCGECPIGDNDALNIGETPMDREGVVSIVGRRVRFLKPSDLYTSDGRLVGRYDKGQSISLSPAVYFVIQNGRAIRLIVK